MDPWARPNLAPLPTLTAEQQQVVDAAIKAKTLHFESIVSQLTEKVNSLQASTTSQTNSKTKTQPNSAKKPAAKPPTVSIKLKVAAPGSSSNHKNPPNVTPKRPVNTSSALPGIGKPKASQKSKLAPQVAKPPSPKRHPQQMQGTDFPAEFTTTKNALYVHIKILWGLLKQDSVPKPPELRNLQEFYNRFANSQEVEQAAHASTSPSLISSTEVQLFKDATSGTIKYGRSVIHVGSNNVRYVQGLMICLGLRAWSPNLEEDAASLYNAAHRIAAITSFQELVAGHAYNYMNVNPKMVTNTSLLIQAYNHFVHFVSHSKYQKEKKEAGKNTRDANHKRISKNRERLRDARKEFAILNKFPQRYVDILSHIGAHSDDEFDERRQTYKIKTLGYRSYNAGKFFRALDIVMKNAAEQDPSSMQKKRTRQLPRQPVMSCFTAAPKGLPIDFYSPSWYHQLVPAQQKTIPNDQAVAFLPDANERLTDRSFTRKYWDILVEPYGLLGDDSSDDDSENQEDLEGDGKKATANGSNDEGHDLDEESPDESPDEYFAEGDAGDLYSDFVVSDEGSDDDEEYNEDEAEGEDDEGQEDENTEDVRMKDQCGVDARTLAIMEEEEDGW